MFAVDDGLAQGNLDVADILFLVAAIFAVIAGLLSIPRAHPSPPYGTVLGWFAVALLAFGWFLL